MDDCIENSIASNEINYISIALKELLNKLEENHKEIIILYYYDDYSIAEIADILNIAEGTVKSRLSRAREELKQMNLEGLI